MALTIQIASARLLGLMVFFVNPLNDASKPESRMNYYHHENVMMRKAVKESYGKDIHVEWHEMMPYIYTWIVSFLGWLMMRLIAIFFAG